jgi:hypothetical protein
MMIDDDTLKQLLRINDELLQLCKWLNEKARHGNLISPYTPRGRPHPHSDRSGQEQITVMQSYKGYFIAGSALLVHPFSPDWYVGGSILVPGRSSSIVEITRFQLQRFTVSIKELAEWFGLEVARLVVDECLAKREN